jgi:CDP-glucose 4,6-dehydratase
MVELWGGDAGWSENREPQPHEANYLKLDCSKAKTLLEWRPRWHLQESLQRIVRWHKAWLSGDDMREASLAEIMDYRRAGAP